MKTRPKAVKAAGSSGVKTRPKAVKAAGSSTVVKESSPWWPTDAQIVAFKEALHRHELPVVKMTDQNQAKRLAILLEVAALGSGADPSGVLSRLLRKTRLALEIQVYDWRQQGAWDDILRALGVDFDLDVGRSLPDGARAITKGDVTEAAETQVRALLADRPAPARLKNVLEFLVSLHRDRQAAAGSAQLSKPPSDKELVSMVRRNAYHHLLVHTLVPRTVGEWSAANVWPEIAAAIGVSPDLADLLKRVTKAGGWRISTSELVGKVKKTLHRHKIPLPTGTFGTAASSCRRSWTSC